MSYTKKCFLALLLFATMVFSGINIPAMAESTDSSSFVAEFYYARNDTAFSIPGNYYVPLQTIMKTVGLSGTVDDVSISGLDVGDDSLSAERNPNGTYSITVRRPFQRATLH